MTKQRILSTGLGLAATLSMVACGPAPTGTPTPGASSSVTPSVAPSTTPSVVPSVEPSAVPSASVEPSAVPSASVEPTAAPTTIPGASPTASPLPSATSDISVIEKTTFNGKIFDDTQSPLDGVTVKAKSLNSSVPFEAETVTAGGTYAFNNAPSGVQVEIIASKPGFTTRKRVEVLKSNKQGDPNANRYDFGNDGSVTGFSAAYNALSDKPEVVMVTPARNGSGVDPKTSFVLKFSEPMDKKTAEDTFTVRSFNSRKLTVDAGNTTRTNTVTGNGAVATNFLASNSTQIWDKDAFNISWNSDDTEVTFSFKEEKLLPTDKDSNLVPDYNVAFRSFSGGDRVLKDKSGISRNEKHFKLTDGDFEESYKFAIKTDEVKPTISSITAETNENGGQNGDAVRVRYSERMIIYTRDISIAGGMENTAGSDTKAAAAYPGGTIATSTATAKNYNTTIVQTGGVTTYNGTWGALGGTAVYDTTDLTHKTVLLLPPSQTTLSSTVAARPSNLGTTAPVYLLSDGTTSTQAAASFFRNTSSATATGAAVAAGATQSRALTVEYYYTDGSAAATVTSGASGATDNAAQVQTLLNTTLTGNTGWTVTNAAGAGNIAATNSITYTLAATAQNSGKNVAVAVIRQTGLFANDALNAPATGLVVVSGAPSLASFTTVSGATAGGDTISVDFRYTDGTSETATSAQVNAGGNGTDAEVFNALNGMSTGWSVNRALGSAALAAGNFLRVGLAAAPTRNGKTVAAARLNPSGAFATTKLGNAAHPNGIWVIASDVAQTQYQLNSKLLSTGGLFTVTETNSGAAGSMARIWDANDTMTLALATGAKEASSSKDVLMVTIPQAGSFATGELNAPSGGFIVYPNTAVNGKLNIYKPGDTVRIKVNSTVLDPAGNTLDSSRDNASANAS